MLLRIVCAVVAVLLAAAVIFFIAAYVCYALAFKVPKKNKSDYLNYPSDEQYGPHREKSLKMIKETLSVPYEPVEIIANDGVKLFGKHYKALSGNENAPLMLMFHGYKSLAERDFSGGLKISLNGGFQVILVDQRACGKSGGRCVTFGVKESDDCLCWANYAANRFGKQTKIILYGMSMGSATVLAACDLHLPENVAGIVADCGFTSPSAIIKKVLGDINLPVSLSYFFVRAGGKIYGGFDLESSSAVNALKNCNLPVLFIHGESDGFVPCDMSRENYAACKCENKTLLTVPGAGHGISFMVDEPAYLTALSKFLSSSLNREITMKE